MAFLLTGARAACVDTDNHARDSRGATCETYNKFAGTQYDYCNFDYFVHAGFDPKAMCCGCGGGDPTGGFVPDPIVGECVDTDNGAKDNRGEPCKTYNDWAGSVYDYCFTGYFEHGGFRPREMCCGCGGGEYVVPPEDVDCVGEWSACTADCTDKVYSVTVPKEGAGSECPHEDGDVAACSAWEGQCSDEPGKDPCTADGFACPKGWACATSTTSDTVGEWAPEQTPAQLAGLCDYLPGCVAFSIEARGGADTENWAYGWTYKEHNEATDGQGAWSSCVRESSFELVGNGCCRFDDWSAQNQDYQTLPQCERLCGEKSDCVAFDVARPRGDEYSCFLFTGSGANFRTECGNKSDEFCYRRRQHESPEEPGPVSAWIAQGRPGSTCSEADCATRAVDIEERHALRCCADSQLDGQFQRSGSACTVYHNSFYGYKTGAGNHAECTEGKVNFRQGWEFCRNLGARMCTKAEVESNCVSGSGCGADRQMIWTVATAEDAAVTDFCNFFNANRDACNADDSCVFDDDTWVCRTA